MTQPDTTKTALRVALGDAGAGELAEAADAEAVEEDGGPGPAPEESPALADPDGVPPREAKPASDARPPIAPAPAQ